MNGYGTASNLRANCLFDEHVAIASWVGGFWHSACKFFLFILAYWLKSGRGSPKAKAIPKYHRQHLYIIYAAHNPSVQLQSLAAFVLLASADPRLLKPCFPLNSMFVLLHTGLYFSSLHQFLFSWSRVMVTTDTGTTAGTGSPCTSAPRTYAAYMCIRAYDIRLSPPWTLCAPLGRSQIHIHSDLSARVLALIFCLSLLTPANTKQSRELSSPACTDTPVPLPIKHRFNISPDRIQRPMRLCWTWQSYTLRECECTAYVCLRAHGHSTHYEMLPQHHRSSVSRVVLISGIDFPRHAR